MPAQFSLALGCVFPFLVQGSSTILRVLDVTGIAFRWKSTCVYLAQGARILMRQQLQIFTRSLAVFPGKEWHKNKIKAEMFPAPVGRLRYTDLG